MNLQAVLYNVIRKALSQEQRGRIKRYQHRFRNKLQWYYRARHGTFTVDELERELSCRIGSNFEILMVHSSFDGMIPMFRGSVSDLKTMLIGLCRPDKTLAMPAFFFGGVDYDSVRYYRKKPVFDRRKTPSQMGLLTELFRRHPGVLRSLHPTHSVCALGPLAGELTGDHHLDPYGCGRDSPFDVMDRHRTVILGLGVPYFRCLTHIHYAEQLLGDQFPVPHREDTVQVVLKDGEQNELDYRLRVKVFEGQRRIERLGTMMSQDDMVIWRFHGVPMFAVSAGKVTRALIDHAKKGLSIYST